MIILHVCQQFIYVNMYVCQQFTLILEQQSFNSCCYLTQWHGHTNQVECQ